MESADCRLDTRLSDAPPCPCAGALRCANRPWAEFAVAVGRPAQIVQPHHVGSLPVFPLLAPTVGAMSIKVAQFDRFGSARAISKHNCARVRYCSALFPR